TCCSSVAASRSRPRSARSRSSRSGMVLHRKNESREASSTSLTRRASLAGPVPVAAGACRLPGSAPGSRSMRNRNSRETSIASIAAWLLLSKSPASPKPCPLSRPASGRDVDGARTARPRRRRLELRLHVLARRGDADRLQARFHRQTYLIGIALRLFAVGLHTREPHFEHVLGVEREVVLHRHPGARIERQIVVQLFVAAALERIALRVVNVFGRLQRELADRQPAHLAR